MGDIRIEVEGDVAAETSLWDWLRREPGLRGRVRQRPVSAHPGSMGSLSELVVEGVVTGTIGTVAGLLGQALSTWMGQRAARRDAPTTITVTAPNGHSVALVSSPTADAAQVTELVRGVLEATREPASNSDPR
ncbi:effector-associated constant component EACC1 [Streptomyces spongiae]|uniref:Uncharacterized protein n=1 Tax=Streptomyces spongiae TaxID=565072 RepID=A0A5N8Y048_9ACTN|nr:hypothetical protein [Streptomyces spongiae]MPY64971.1 hypothetical protein [Streptomyces spongiae]